MRALLLGLAAPLAAALLSAAPASAQSSDSESIREIRFGAAPSGLVDRGRRRAVGGDVFIGEWPQQGDTAWRSNSFNDWWHDRPDRAYPAWMRNNQQCERVWWGGGTWRC